MKSFKEVYDKVCELTFLEDFDFVVAIGHGGIVPGYLVSKALQLPLRIIWINFRSEDHQPKSAGPQLLEPIAFFYKDKKILLVDDRAKTGTTFEFAKKQLAAAKIVKSLVVNGQADYSLFDEPCFPFPWNPPFPDKSA